MVPCDLIKSDQSLQRGLCMFFFVLCTIAFDYVGCLFRSIVSKFCIVSDILLRRGKGWG